ncbi:dockerin type I domain-containing protein [Aeoliella mucimassa]|uniref:PEP-CTERM protein-sorting domain-containing protein n=1 Tax=Aeoliella mucimassa TaxID=2527972 RepID=A0A518AVR6_9BACT|nr:dockerin type I domain-containing protein [Aeoliella mucimassa]QDU58813.1 hypothetical protein Pan181_50530 [Aeoliella mucimassa]
MSYRSFIKALLLSGVVAIPVAATQAANWITDAVGDYTDGTNWDTGAQPADTEVVNIASGQATLGANLGRAEATNLTGTGELIVNGRFLNGTNAGTTFTIADDAVLTTTGNYFIVATGAYDSTFNQTGGTVNVTVDRGFFHSDNGTGGDGVYNALGGVLNVELNSTSTTNNLHNYQAGRRGPNDTFLVDGGDVNFLATTTENRRMYYSQNAVLQVNSGTFDSEAFQYFIVGYGISTGGGTLDGSATMNVTGGVTTINPIAAGAMIVGDGQDGTVNVTGGVLNVGGDLIVGTDLTTSDADGHGIVYQSAGEVTVAGTLTTGLDASGAYYMQGGTLNLGGLEKGGYDASYLFYEGGTVTLAGNHRDILTSASSGLVALNGATVSYDSSLDQTTITELAGGETLKLQVNTTTGEAKIVNANATAGFSADYYEISSSAGALETGSWNSLADQITVTPAVGDYNGDSTVNVADYTIWRDSLGFNVTPGEGADGNGDGVVDSADYDLWKANFGTVAQTATWTEAGGSDSELMVEYVLDETGFVFNGSTEYSLGNIFDTSAFGAGNDGDLEFKWQMANGYLATGVIEYVSSGSLATSSVPEPSAWLIGLSAIGLMTAGLRKRS